MIPIDEFRRLMSIKPDVADTIFSRVRRAPRAACASARARVRCGSSARGTRPRRWRCGRSPTRSRLPHTWIDVEDADDVDVLLAGMGFRPARHAGRDHARPRVLRRPTPGRVRASTSGSRSTRSRASCSISSSSAPARPASRPRSTARRKGSSTVSLDAVATGGQAGASSRIENYVGFPNGISGEELAVARGHPGAAARRAVSTRRARSRACASRTASTWSCSPTAARSRAAR